MYVTVRLFARLRDIAGAEELRREIPLGSTAQHLWETLVAEHNDLKPYSTNVSTAINEEYAKMDALLADGDEVAFLPPVSGG